MRTLLRVVRASIALAIVACNRAPSPSTVDAGPPATPQPSGTAVTSVADAPQVAATARCKVVSTGASLGVGVDGVLVGDLVPTPTGFAIGLLRSTGASTSATIASLPVDMTTVTMVDLGASVGDSPPPHPFVTNGQLFAASYVRGRTDAAAAGSRTLGFFKIDGDKSTLGATLEQSVDDSAAVDVAGGAKGALVTWDEAGPGVSTNKGAAPPGDAGRSAAGTHGVIKVAFVDPAQKGDLRAGSRVVSPDASDADEPKVASREGGYWVAWLAHRALASADASAPAELEGPAEAKDSRWLEILPVDDAGKAAGAVRRLTPASGHISAFTLVPRPSAAQHPSTLDVFARDDEEASEGAGGRILRIGVSVDAVEPLGVLVPEGAGRGAPEVLTGAGPTLLFYADTTDHTRILPLGEGGATLGPSSREPALGEARPLCATRGTRVAAPRADKPGIFAVFPGERATAGLAPVRLLTCAP